MFLITHLLAGTRSLSTSAIVQAAKYKLKSHSGAKKRWRSLSGGNFKRASFKFLTPSSLKLIFPQGKAGHVHLNVVKRPGRINRLGQTAYSTPTQTACLKKLLPYG